MNAELKKTLFSVAVLCLCGSSPSLAATFTVTTTDDSGAGSLRQAIEDAHKAQGGTNIIEFGSTGRSEIRLKSPLQQVGDAFSNLVIKGPGANHLTVRRDSDTPIGQPLFTVFEIVAISGMTISDGDNGAILNFGTLTLRDCVITGNIGRGNGNPGGIDNIGDLKVINCTLSRNIAQGQTGSPIHGGTGGGALLNEVGTAEIRNSTLTGNAAFGAPPSGSPLPAGSTGGDALGGAILNDRFGSLTVVNSTVSGNVARGGDVGHFLTLRSSSDAMMTDAAAYYDLVDPAHKRLTLGDWWAVNGFTPNTGKPIVRSLTDAAAHAAYLNNNDLGFGRDTTILKRGQDVASWLANYSLTSPFPDQNPLSADAAQARDPGRGVATVCMEYTPIEGVNGLPQGERFVKFFVFDGVGPTAKRRLSADLDGYGEKFVPYLCTTCHGGKVTRPTQTNQLIALSTPSSFREFDIANVKFPRPGTSIDDPSRSAPNPEEQKAFKKLNRLVLETKPVPPLKELVEGWYGPTFLKTTQDRNFVPPGWNYTVSQAELYRKVVATSCRTCHVALGSPSDFAPNIAFNTFEGLKNEAPLINAYVFGGSSSTMPHAMVAFKNFWKSDRPALLATALGFDLSKGGAATRGGLAGGGGIDNEGGQFTIVASTIAFNTASGGVGFSPQGNGNGSTVGMAAGGAFSSEQPSFPDTLRSSILAVNFADATHFANNTDPALRPDDLSGSFDSEDHNLIGQSAGFTLLGTTVHDKLGVDPKLGLLRNNGGLTRTHALSFGSPAIDAGDNLLIQGSPQLDPVTTDQRGFARKVGNAVDIGAFELQVPSDVTAKLRISRGVFRFNHATQQFDQQVVIQNVSNSPIKGPLSLVVNGLSSDISLSNKAGVTATVPPFGGPFLNINLPANVLSPQEHTSVLLEFDLPDVLGAGINYSTRVLAGAGPP